MDQFLVSINNSREELMPALSEQPERPAFKNKGAAGRAHRELVARIRAEAGLPPWEL